MSEVSNTTPQPETQMPGLSLQDLLLVVQTMQVVSQRGAIRADEMETVGGVYTRLVAFLQASGALKPAEQDQDPAEKGE
jgi:hypothetical protein